MADESNDNEFWQKTLRSACAPGWLSEKWGKSLIPSLAVRHLVMECYDQWWYWAKDLRRHPASWTDIMEELGRQGGVIWVGGIQFPPGYISLTEGPNIYINHEWAKEHSGYDLIGRVVYESVWAAWDTPAVAGFRTKYPGIPRSWPQTHEVAEEVARLTEPARTQWLFMKSK